MLKRKATAAALSLVAAAGLLSACSDDRDAFVTRAGSSLQVAGEPFRFVGVNLYDAAASDIYSCSPSTRMPPDKLRETMRFLRDEAGATVVRFWAYQTYTDGGRDFSGVDRVIDAAHDAGLRVIPVLEDGPGDCSTGQSGQALDTAAGDSWYTDAYRHPYGTASLSFRDYAQVMARHYRDEPTVMAWMMVNEAETRARSDGDRTALADFAQDVGTVIHAADPHHLVTLGTQGNGAPGTGGRDFEEIYRQPALDFAEVHDWARYGSDTEAMPGSLPGGGLPDAGSPECAEQLARIACSFAIADKLGKPIVVGEAGIEASDDASRRRRAGLLGAKVAAAFAAGADGYLVWHLSTGHTDGYDLVPAEDDPTFGVLAEAAGRLS